ncbi:MAG: hypothetical protein QG621_70 [Patescibacteria group bacterium]|nr:hypothetical protein [Patescibacteria group bacterium]
MPQAYFILNSLEDGLLLVVNDSLSVKSLRAINNARNYESKKYIGHVLVVGALCRSVWA